MHLTGVQERKEERNLCSGVDSANQNRSSSPHKAGKNTASTVRKIIMSRYFSVSRQSKLRSRNLKIHPARLQIQYEKSSGGRWSDPVCVREVKVFGDENADLKFK